MATGGNLQQSSEPPDDLGYCRGSRKEKLAMLESKCRPQHPIFSAQPGPKNHSEDIKERVQLLEKAMSKANYTRDHSAKPIDKNHPEYGTPQKGTWTEIRGQKAHSHVHKEILELCEFIYEHSDLEDQDQKCVMLFGDLFKLYTRISDKVVGILLRAKKYGLVFFEPEMLFQGQNDNEPVILLKPMQEIYDIFNKHKSFAPLPKN